MGRITRFFHRRDASPNDDVAPISPSSSSSPPPPPTSTSGTAQHVRRKTPDRPLRGLSRRKATSDNGDQSVVPAAPQPPPPPSMAARAAANAAMTASAPPNQRLAASEQALFSDFDHMAVTDRSRRQSEIGSNSRQRQTPDVRRSSAGNSEPGHMLSTASPHAHTTNLAPPKQRVRDQNHALHRKPNLNNLKPSDAKVIGPSPQAASLSPSRRDASRSTNKPLPKSPSDKFEADLAADRLPGSGSDDVNEPGLIRNHVDEAAATAALHDVVDLSSTEDTTLHTKWAPAVTHETVTRNVHEVRREEITREIHHHDVYHRVLPVIDFEVLPARHFVPVEGGYMEISADEVPGGAGNQAQQLLQEALDGLAQRNRQVPIIPTRFSAREFKGDEGDHREYTTSDGVKHSEQWWVHPPQMVVGPTHEIDAKAEYGGVVPVTEHATIKTTTANSVAAKKIVGVSPLLSKQRGEASKSR